MKEQIKPELLESNKLIAEFMDVETRVFIDTPTIIHYNFNNTMLTPDKMKYNLSWDWLMPVIEKIEILGYLVQIQNGTCTIFYVHPMSQRDKNISFKCEDKAIYSVYLACVEFIQWFNELKGSNHE